MPIHLYIYLYLWIHNFPEKLVASYQYFYSNTVMNNSDKFFGIGVQVVIVMGEQVISQNKTRYIKPCVNPKWGDALEFDLKLPDIPRWLYINI